MDVTGHLLDGIHQDQINQLHHWRLLGRAFQFPEIYVVRTLNYIYAFFIELTHNIFQGRASIVESVHGRLYRSLCCYRNADVFPGEKFNVVNDENIGGIHHGYGQRLPLQGDRNNLILLDDVPGYHLDHVRINVQFGRICGGHTELLAQKLHEFGLFDILHLHEVASQHTPVGLLLLECAIQLFGCDQTLAYQKIAQLLRHLRTLPP